MFCKKCGKEFDSQFAFCPYCAEPVSAPAAEAPVVQPTSANEKAEAPIVPPVEEAPIAPTPIEAVPIAPTEEKKKKKWVLPVIIALVVAILGGAFAYVYFCTDLFKSGDDKDEKTVETQSDKAEDKKADADKKKELKCKECDEKIDEGYYCADCIEELRDESYPAVCLRCELEYFYTSGDEEPPFLEDNEIFLIDKNGYIYCEDCDTGHYCEDCAGMLEEDDDDDMCYNCAEYACRICGEVLEKKEVSHSCAPWGIEEYYCEDCDTGHYCEECEQVLAEDDDDDVCIMCAEYWCSVCNEVLTEQEVVYGQDLSNYCCADCDTGNYCEECGKVIEPDETLCYLCSEE